MEASEAAATAAAARALAAAAAGANSNSSNSSNSSGPKKAGAEATVPAALMAAEVARSAGLAKDLETATARLAHEQYAHGALTEETRRLRDEAATARAALAAADGTRTEAAAAAAAVKAAAAAAAAPDAAALAVQAAQAARVPGLEKQLEKVSSEAKQLLEVGRLLATDKAKLVEELRALKASLEPLAIAPSSAGGGTARRASTGQVPVPAPAPVPDNFKDFAATVLQRFFRALVVRKAGKGAAGAMKSVIHRVVESLQRENQEFQEKIATLTDAAEKKGAAAAASATRVLRGRLKDLEAEVVTLRKKVMEVSLRYSDDAGNGFVTHPSPLPSLCAVGSFGWGRGGRGRGPRGGEESEVGGQERPGRGIAPHASSRAHQR